MEAESTLTFEGPLLPLSRNGIGQGGDCGKRELETSGKFQKLLRPQAFLKAMRSPNCWGVLAYGTSQEVLSKMQNRSSHRKIPGTSHPSCVEAANYISNIYQKLFFRSLEESESKSRIKLPKKCKHL